MKTLILLRHGQALPATYTVQDFDRPLSVLGTQQANQQGQQFIKRNIIPQLIIASPALRTFTTAKIIAESLQVPFENILPDQSLYMAALPDLIQVILHISSTIQCALIVGHNPSISEACQQFSESPMTALEPCAAYVVQWENDNWETIIKKSIAPHQTMLLTP